MVGVDESTRGGMWTVVENYLSAPEFVKSCNLRYVPTSIVGNPVKKVLFMEKGFREIRKIFRTEQVDLLHVHMSERGSVFRKGWVMRYAKKHGAKILLHMHGAEFEPWYRSLSEKRQTQVREILDLADAVVILGDYWKEFISSLLADPGKLRVVHNAVEIPEAPLYDPQSSRLLFLGAVSRRKGIYDLLDAMQQIDSRLDPRWKLEIYGPDVIGNIAEEIQNRKLQSRVSYCGWLTPEKRPQVLRETAVNLLPSYHEGLPMTIMEAMAAGIPSVTTSVAAIPEAVNAQNGVLLRPGDVRGLGEAILDLCADPALRQEKSICARRDAEEKFALSRHICAIHQIYKELLSI